jgi:hypothetical protein
MKKVERKRARTLSASRTFWRSIRMSLRIEEKKSSGKEERRISSIFASFPSTRKEGRRHTVETALKEFCRETLKGRHSFGCQVSWSS